MLSDHFVASVERSPTQLPATMPATTTTTTNPQANGEIWWSNAIFFVGVHVAAAIGVYHYPIWDASKVTLAVTVLLWQCACFG